MRFFTSIGSSSTSKPATIAVPAVGGRKHVSIRMVVVLPAPLGPKKPTIWPFWISKEIWSTAVLRAYLFVSPLTVIMYFYFLTRDAQRFRTAPSRFDLSSAKPHVMNSDGFVSTLASKNQAISMTVLNGYLFARVAYSNCFRNS